MATQGENVDGSTRASCGGDARAVRTHARVSNRVCHSHKRFCRILVQGLLVNPKTASAIGYNDNRVAIGGPIGWHVRTLTQGKMPRREDMRPARSQVSHIRSEVE